MNRIPRMLTLPRPPPEVSPSKIEAGGAMSGEGGIFAQERCFPDHLYNPLVHIIMWFRSSIYTEYRADGLDKSYVLEFALVCFVLGLTLLTVSMRQIREDRV